VTTPSFRSRGAATDGSAPRCRAVPCPALAGRVFPSPPRLTPRPARSAAPVDASAGPLSPPRADGSAASTGPLSPPRADGSAARTGPLNRAGAGPPGARFLPGPSRSSSPGTEIGVEPALARTDGRRLARRTQRRHSALPRPGGGDAQRRPDLGWPPPPDLDTITFTAVADGDLRTPRLPPPSTATPTSTPAPDRYRAGPLPHDLHRIRPRRTSARRASCAGRMRAGQRSVASFAARSSRSKWLPQ
jgi:hypothetical protein